ncbi:hypothetical protein EXS56_02160 [Candidatus Kaiserbacteria bacterium]|nr:hypothetical protein [Candidatus Kaiserbacteria bacterium]
MYAERIRALLSPAEKKIFQKLTTPQKIQDYLDTLPINYELRGETYMSPRRMIKAKTAHCFEGALFAAAALAYHGEKPLLMDLRTAMPYEDHVITLFRTNGLWGAISKTNHAILRYRDAVYRSPRELAMSYFHEYVESDGKKSLREYSAPFDLTRFKPELWVAAEDDLYWLVENLDGSKHFPIAPKKQIRTLRTPSKFEQKVMDIVEWKKKH